MAAWLVGSALSCMAALAIGAPGSTQQEMRVKATNDALLEALVARRAEVARSTSAPQDKSYALEFLDRRIAELKGRIAR